MKNDKLTTMITKTELAVQNKCGSDYAEKIKEHVEEYKKFEHIETKSRRRRREAQS